MASKFETFPKCCRKILEQLDRDHRAGARNCSEGHLVSVEYALQLERQLEEKRAQQLKAPASDA